MLLDWGREDGLDDLAQDIAVRVYESPGTQLKLGALSDPEIVQSLKHLGSQIMSTQVLSSNVFNDRNLYSSTSIKDALLGRSTNRYLMDILPLAMEALGDQNEGHAEAIRIRYEDGVVPQDNAPQQELKRAVKSLTEHVNVIAITAGVDADGNVSEGPGSRHSVFPGLRKAKGNHSDPTGEMAMSLINADPEVREAFYEHHVPSEIPVSLKAASSELSYPPSIFDGAFNGMPGSEMYRAEVAPEMFPDQKRMMLENWSSDDLEMYCGGVFTPGYGRKQ